MRNILSSRVCFVAALVMLVGIACSQSPTAPSDAAVFSPLVTGAAMGTEGHTPGGPGAVVVRGDYGCGVVDGLGNWFPENFPDEGVNCGTEVATYSKNGNAKLTVQASGVPNPTGRTVHWGPYNPGWAWAASYEPDLTGPPYPCYLLGPDRDFDNPLFTVNWHATVTPSGQATLTCIYSKKWEFTFPTPD